MWPNIATYCTFLHITVSEARAGLRAFPALLEPSAPLKAWILQGAEHICAGRRKVSRL